MQDVGDTSECAWPRWDMVDTSGVRDDGLAEYSTGELGGDDEGDL